MKQLLILVGAIGMASCASKGPAPDTAVQSVQTTVPKAWFAPALPHQGQTGSLVDWWARLGDPQLPWLIEQAQKGSASIAASRAQVFAARAALAGAESGSLPQVGLTAGAYRGASSSAPLGTGANVGLQASWALDVWGQNAGSVRQASAQATAAESGWHEARVLMAAETAKLYLGWRSCLAQKAVIDSDRASRSITAKSASDTERAGLLAPATAALARASESDAVGRLAQQGRACEQQFKAITALIGADEPELRTRLGSSTALPDPTAAGSALSVAAVPLEVIRQRPDVARAQQELVAAAEGIGVARAALLPSLSLSGNVLSNRFRTGGDTTSFTSWSIGPLSLNLPLIGRGGLNAAADASVARYDAAAVGYANVLRKAVAEVEQALVALDALKTQLSSSQQAVAGYTRSYDATEARYRVGLANLNELEEARRLKLNAESGALALQLDHVSSWISLYVALGGGFDSRIAPEPVQKAS